MFEHQVSELLRRYLGEYVTGLDREALRISVWKGETLNSVLFPFSHKPFQLVIFEL